MLWQRRGPDMQGGGSVSPGTRFGRDAFYRNLLQRASCQFRVQEPDIQVREPDKDPGRKKGRPPLSVPTTGYKLCGHTEWLSARPSFISHQGDWSLLSQGDAGSPTDLVWAQSAMTGVHSVCDSGKVTYPAQFLLSGGWGVGQHPPRDHGHVWPSGFFLPASLTLSWLYCLWCRQAELLRALAHPRKALLWGTLPCCVLLRRKKPRGKHGNSFSMTLFDSSCPSTRHSVSSRCIQSGVGGWGGVPGGGWVRGVSREVHREERPDTCSGHCLWCHAYALQSCGGWPLIPRSCTGDRGLEGQEALTLCSGSVLSAWTDHTASRGLLTTSCLAALGHSRWMQPKHTTLTLLLLWGLLEEPPAGHRELRTARRIKDPEAQVSCVPFKQLSHRSFLAET